MKPIHQIIRKPLVTEKSNLMKETGNVVAFEVAMGSNKVEIKQAVERAFKVKVQDVRTMVVAGKVKRTGRNIGKRSNVKKAYVTLAEGTIDYFGV
jgi:large subunit ribosomal protein L23